MRYLQGFLIGRKMMILQRQKKKIITGCLLIFILITASIVFSPILRNGFTNWDDSTYITKNSDLKDFSLTGIIHICSSFYIQNYHPLTMLSYLMEYHFFGANPLGYHITSLILHLLNCIFVFWLVFLLSESIIVTFIAAMLFAIHPLHVESVAWIAERKDLLYSLFSLAGFIAYIHYLKKGKRVYYFICLFLFFLSLLSKAMAVTFPLVLFLIDYLFKRKFDKESFFEKIPFFALAFIFLLIGSITFHVLAFWPGWSFMAVFRQGMIAAYAITFYLYKILLPVGLSCLYPYPGINETSTFQYLFFPLIVAILAALVVFSRKYTRKIVFGSLFFLCTIFLALQISPFANSIVADRYTYLASVGLFYLSGEGVRWFYLRLNLPASVKNLFFPVIFIGLILVLFSLSWQRCKVWKNSLVLWSDALKRYPDLPVAYYNRGNAYLDQKDYGKAIDDYNRAIQIAPDFLFPYFAKVIAYERKGEYDKAYSIIDYKGANN